MSKIIALTQKEQSLVTGATARAPHKIRANFTEDGRIDHFPPKISNSRKAALRSHLGIAFCATMTLVAIGVGYLITRKKAPGLASNA